MRFSVQRWDEKTIDLDMDPDETTITAVKWIIIDQFIARCYEHGARILRDSLPFSAVTLEHGRDKLEEDKTLNECGVETNSILKATRADPRATRKRYGKGFDDDAEIELQKRLEKQRRRQERRKEKENEQARHKAKEMAGLREQHEVADADSEVEAVNQSEPQRVNTVETQHEHQAEEPEAFLVVEEDLSISENFQIRPEGEVEWLEIELDDPAQEEDADKENWDPQILRELAVDGIPVRR